MYGYGKGSKKGGKEVYFMGPYVPQLSVHAYPSSSTTNNEQKEALNVRQHDIGNTPGIRSRTSTTNYDPYGASPYAGVDRVDKMLPGSRSETPIFQRSPEDKGASPDRLNLDRRRLTVCPRLEGEEQLRLLNFQHNNISRIENLTNLRKLIFLDLYDNQIQKIQGLDALVSLRVLMLGKNRISKIENLNNVVKLDVLDLHGNQISKIENLSHLEDLRVLNLAGNLLRSVNNLQGMNALTELNLRRNNIQTLTEIEVLPSLQRLYLSYNEITSYDDIAGISLVPELSDLSLDGNPLAQDHYYKRNVLKNVPQIAQLDSKKITDEDRRLAAVMARKAEEKQQEQNKAQVIRERRQQTITNVKRQWQYLQVGLMSRANQMAPPGYMNKHMGMPEMAATHVSSSPNDAGRSTPSSQQNSRPSSRSHSIAGSRPSSARSQVDQRHSASATGVLAPQYGSSSQESSSVAVSSTPSSSKTSLQISSPDGRVPDHLCEQDGERLMLFGTGALESLDRNWGVQATGSVTTVQFQFIDFDDLVQHLHKIRVRFPNVHTLEFLSTNIHSLQQLSGLSVVRRLDALTIREDANPLLKSPLWRPYLLFRLAHFSLKKINGSEIADSDIVHAEKQFGPLSQIITSQLPPYRVMMLYNEGKKRQLLTDDKKKPLVTEGKLTDKGAESLGRAALVYNLEPLQVDRSRQEFAKSFVRDLARSAIDGYEKQAKLQQVWPQVLSEMVHTAVRDMWDTSAYAKKCMQELERSVAS